VEDDGGRARGEIWTADVVVNDGEAGPSFQMSDVLAAARQVVVEARDLGPLCQPPLTDVRAQEPGPAGYENAIHVRERPLGVPVTLSEWRDERRANDLDIIERMREGCGSSSR
jgi:hypothetical protein